MSRRKKMKMKIGKMITRIAGTLAVLGAGMLEQELHVTTDERGVSLHSPSQEPDADWRYRRIR